MLGLPARSHFLLLGQLSQPIANATYTNSLEAVRVNSITVTLKRKITSIDSLEIVDQNGVDIGRLPLDEVYDLNDMTYRKTFSGSGVYTIPKGAERTLAVEARLKPRGDGGISGELVQVDTIQLVAEGEWSQQLVGVAQSNFVFPQHQTTQGNILSVTSAMATSGSLPVGPAQMLAAFTLSGMAVSGAPSPQVQNLDFQVNKSSAVTVTNWQLGTQNSSDRIPCFVNDTTVSCLTIPADMGTVDVTQPRTLQLFGDVAVDQGATDRMLQVHLSDSGTIGMNGAVRWTDGSTYFTWTELQSPLANGPLWK